MTAEDTRNLSYWKKITPNIRQYIESAAQNGDLRVHLVGAPVDIKSRHYLILLGYKVNAPGTEIRWDE